MIGQVEDLLRSTPVQSTEKMVTVGQLQDVAGFLNQSTHRAQVHQVTSYPTA